MWHIYRILILLTICLIVGSTGSSQESPGTQFRVFWNVPTISCKNYVDFESLLDNFKIIHNVGDKFQGETITIFYKPGRFPTVEKHNQATYVKINGGIPQLGSIEEHLKILEENLLKILPSNFNGIGVIDFEEWRPIFRQNWNDQVVYKNLSIELSEAKNVDYSKNNEKHKIKKAAEKDFEHAALEFMVKTLEKAKVLFPDASWGYYGFPYCYNQYSNDMTQCANGVTGENDRIQDIFDKSDALFPSIYMNKTENSVYKNNLVIGRILEAERVSKKQNSENKAFVFPYIWVRYLDSVSDTDYLTKTDVEETLKTVKKYKAGGVIIWGRSKEVDSEDKCQKLKKFVEEILGPAVEKIGSQ